MFIERVITMDVYDKKVYMLWYNMKRRCLDPKNPDYIYYGANGVTICEEWLSLECFRSDVPNIKGFDYQLFLEGKLVLDKDTKYGNGKVYSLRTCEFVSKEDSNKRIFSRRHNFKATSPNGEIFYSNSIKDFSEEHNLRASTISDCLKGRVKKHRCWSFEKQ